MIFKKHQNAASSVITVTNVATPIYTLVDTAGSLANSRTYFGAIDLNGPCNGIVITPEDGSVRLGYGITPTSALGMLLVVGKKYKIPNMDLDQVKLIRVTGNAKCSVEFGKCDAFENFSAVEEVEDLTYLYAQITAAAPTTTVVKGSAGILHSITINKAAVTGVILIYDGINAGGTLIATITQPAALLQTAFTLTYDVKMSTGICIVTNTAAQDLTVSFK